MTYACDLCFWFNNTIWNFHFPPEFRVVLNKVEADREKVETAIQWVIAGVSVCMCVSVLDHFLIVMICHVQVINADMFIT